MEKNNISALPPKEFYILYSSVFLMSSTLVNFIT